MIAPDSKSGEAAGRQARQYMDLWREAIDLYVAGRWAELGDVVFPAGSGDVVTYCHLAKLAVAGAGHCAAIMAAAAGHRVGRPPVGHRYSMDTAAQERSARQRFAGAVLTAVCNGEMTSLPTLMTTWAPPKTVGAERLALLVADLIHTHLTLSSAVTGAAGRLS